MEYMKNCNFIMMQFQKKKSIPICIFELVIGIILKKNQTRDF